MLKYSRNMNPIDFLRQFRIGGFAIFDFTVAFLGIYLLSPLLSKIFRKIRIDIPKINWLFLTLPIGIATHLLIGRITPLTKNFLDLHDHYFLKVVVIGLFAWGMKGIKILPKKRK